MPITGDTLKGRNGLYTLGSKIGSGGEGVIYEVNGRKDLVAKIYLDVKLAAIGKHINQRQFLKEKIETMLDQPVTPYENGVLNVAWPQDILFDRSGIFYGYVMPKVNSKYHIFDVCRVGSRSKIFPNYTWRTSVAIAYNLSVAVSKIHATNAAIGDMNPNNIMLDENGYITLIDTDSFNIVNKKTGKEYKCMVGVAEVLPPELQVPDLSYESFNEKTDCFSLAIHIFNLLMNNCHPFGCMDMNQNIRSSSSQLTVEHNITSGFCPYVNLGSGKPADTAPDFMILPKGIRNLFERVFRYDVTTAVKTSTIANRPSADEWKQELKNLFNESYTKCCNVYNHIYPSFYSNIPSKCPWCNINNKVNKSGYKNSSTPVNVLNQPMVNVQHNSNGATTKITISSSSTISSYQPSRSPVALWVICTVVGAMSSPLMSHLLVIAVSNFLDFNLELNVARIILAALGLISGCIIAYCTTENYKTAYNGWPWLLLSLLAPVGAALMAAAIILVIFLVIIIVTIVLYIIVGAFVIGLVCSLCGGG